jgi:hypothetical protein
MARYGTFSYSDYKYGGGRGITRSTLLATAISYTKIEVNVGVPAEVGKTYYLIRTYNGAAEHPMSGVTVSTGLITATEFVVTDGVTNYADTITYNDVPLTPGWVYYTLFVVDSAGLWFKDAATSVLLPYDRGTSDYLINAIPSVYTSADGNPITPHDPNSDLVRFLSGLTLTYDELASAVDSILPDKREKQTIRRLHNAYAEGIGMSSEYTIGTAASARLHREGGYIYRNKGTLNGIATYVEALTGWQTTVTDSPNKFLSRDDSSFETSIGNWSTTGGTLARAVVNGTTVTYPSGLYNYESSTSAWNQAGVGLATLTSASQVITLPSNTDVLRCIPVVGNHTYRFEVPNKRVSGTPTVTLAVTWLTQTGAAVSTSTDTARASSAAWAALTYTAVAPATAAFAKLTITLTGASTNALHLDLMSFTSTTSYVGGVFAYRDPQTVNIICDPARVNLIYDPSFEDATFANWVALTGTLTIDSTSHVYGTGCGKIVGVVGTTAYSLSQGDVGVTPLVPYTLSLWAKGLGATGTASIVWKTSGGVTISTSTLPLTALTATFQRYESSFTAPATAAKAQVLFTGTGTVNLDAICFEQADHSPLFFSGTVADATGNEGSWSNVAAKSISILYPGRPTKLARLIETLDYYVPLGVDWRVMLWDSKDPLVRAAVTALAANS